MNNITRFNPFGSELTRLDPFPESGGAGIRMGAVFSQIGQRLP